MSETRYRVGCAGMFVLGQDYGMDDEDEAIVACESGPAGCEVYDTLTGEWIGPVCSEEVEEAKARLRAVAGAAREEQEQPPPGPIPEEAR